MTETRTTRHAYMAGARRLLREIMCPIEFVMDSGLRVRPKDQRFNDTGKCTASVSMPGGRVIKAIRAHGATYPCWNPTLGIGTITNSVPL